ncbi:MAG: hypothetical protein ACI4L9_05400 [Candidatus Coproplasma sp.]
MNKKTIIAVLSGILVAALICIIVGTIIYFPAANTRLDSSAADYATLLQQKNSSIALGLIILIVGCSGFIMPAIALIVIIIIDALAAVKNRKK